MSAEVLEPIGDIPEGDEIIRHQTPRKRREVKTASMQLNLTAMIDVIFQLLIYFVITASFLVGEGVITARLPAGTGGQPDEIKPPEQPLNILLSSAGAYGVRISIQNSHQSPQDFDALVQMLSHLQHTPANPAGIYPADNPVMIKPDGNVRWQHVVNAFNAAISARYSNVSFAQASASGSQ
jgi:biopolymer transport protein ExbD